MSRIVIVYLALMIGVSGEEVKNSPLSSEAVQGKSVYVPPAPSVDVVEEGCVQKEDQNSTGHGSAQ